MLYLLLEPLLLFIVTVLDYPQKKHLDFNFMGLISLKKINFSNFLRNFIKKSIERHSNVKPSMIMALDI